MTERDRVLDAFRNCITEPKCKDCPWTECETIGHGTIEIPRDLALAVMRELVAQEPRVMTISDFKDEGVYYLEALPPFVLRPVIYRLDYSDPRHYNFVWKYDQFTWDTDEYGKAWRCWTSRPTDAQREAIAWNT